MDEIYLKGQVYYYSRERLYHAMLRACEEGISKYQGNLTFTFYKAIALVLCNHFHESISKLQALRIDDDFHLASLLMLVHVYELGELTEPDVFPSLYSQVEEYKSHANSLDLTEAAYVSYIFENYQAAQEYIEGAIRGGALDCLTLSLRGWIELRLSEIDPKISYNPREWFEKSLDKSQNLDAILGLSESFCLQGKLEEGLNLLNKAVIQYPSIYFPLMQKMKLLFAAQEWDQFSDTATRLLAEKEYPEALCLYIAKLICNDAKYEEATININKLIAHLEKCESKNARFSVDCAMLFSRICDRDSGILAKTYQLAELAVQISPNKYEYLAELGYQCYLQGRFQEALRFYKLAMKINDSSISILTEMTLCELNSNGSSNQLRSQIEFLLEIQETEMPLLQYMVAKISDDISEKKRLLKRAAERQTEKAKNFFYSVQYLRLLDPDFLLLIINEMLNLLPDTVENDHTSYHTSDPDLKYLIDVTKTIISACPGLFTATYVLARLYYLTGNLGESQGLLNRIVNNLERTSSDTYLLLAQTHIKQGSHDTALQNLEMGLSHDFTIRENALYHFLMGIVLRQREKFDEAIKSLKTALHLFKMKENDIAGQPFMLKKVLIYEELIQTYIKADQTRNVPVVLHEAIEEFQGTPDESRIHILSSDYALLNEDVKGAIDMLEYVKPQDPYYLQAKIKLASIMLEKRRDKNAYLNCYKQMVNNTNSSESYMLLGDAYLDILEPDEALKAYEQALKLNPSDPYLTFRMGRALVLTHQYKKAFDFYKNSIKVTNDPELKVQLAELYIQVKDFDQAESFLSSELLNEDDKVEDGLPSMRYKTALYNLLAHVQIQKENIDGALDTLKNLSANQVKIRGRFSFEQTAIPDEEVSLSIEVNLKIADLHLSQGDFLQAINYQQDALALKPNNTEVMAVLAKTYVQINALDKCQEMCNALLKVEPENETALILLADISFHKLDFEAALVNFSNLLNKDPTNWKALVRLIEIVRRLGDIEQASNYLELAEQSLEAPDKNVGFCYCTGLFCWYSGNPNAALRNFNISRQDPEWGKKSLCNMIEICLNPEDEILGDSFALDDSDYKDSRNLALKTAERLLKELKQQTAGDSEYKVKCRLLSNFHLLAYKEKYQIETALDDLVAMASEESLKDHVGVVLGVASAYSLLKQTQRAKTQLKRLFRQNWTYDDAEYLEKCWLLLADYHMQSAKYDLASDLLKKILRYNKSCTKANEFLGLIAEKDQSYKDAVNYYSHAWKLGGKSNPAIGYKLGLCFMKCKKYADAIETSHTVLAAYPDYPKIKKDVLDKSLNNLRT